MSMSPGVLLCIALPWTFALPLMPRDATSESTVLMNCSYWALSLKPNG
ncbi:MAG TPA: hypothetical protein VHN14_16825 [Kofleriaceae bacterium]|jgi:hypothetical protein|nr:hypothetical protein [Kofleriaceae bacterium]